MRLAVSLAFIAASMLLCASIISANTEMEFIFVKGGCFRMGDAFGNGEPDEKPAHEVCVEGFYMGKYEVTQGQWKEIMGDNPSYFKDCGDNCPVENVSWYDVREFIERLNRRTDGRYRLPTEAEWEYAAQRGGNGEKQAGTNNGAELDGYAWYDRNAEAKTHPAGRKKSNELGIYDMSGNVWEWVQDVYDKNAYNKHSKNNPIYEGQGDNRVVRGGSWYSKFVDLRSQNRFYRPPTYKSGIVGFRLLRTK
ncbi:MAG: formylglycine-generating enzyme family protein [Nitrospirae bacterium]|nr:formylglycine-generating enzyme family protein [Nitrospirota bacterium]